MEDRTTGQFSQAQDLAFVAKGLKKMASSLHRLNKIG